MYKSIQIPLFFCLILCFNVLISNAQTDTVRKQSVDSSIARNNISGTSAADDDFNAGLLLMASVVICAMVGAAIVGSFLAAFAFLLAIVFISAGIFSASLLIAFYKKSITTGFKTFVVIICSIGGTAIGSIGLFIVTGIFHLDLSNQTALLIGGVGGLLGGVLMGFVIYKILVLCMLYIKKKFALV